MNVTNSLDRTQWRAPRVPFLLHRLATERRRVARPALIGVLSHLALLGPVAAVVVFAWGRRWVTDDAFINFRIVDNLVSGHGPVFNIGERVEAATSTLWLAILTGAQLLPGDVPLEWWSVFLGIAATAIGVYFGQRGALTLVGGSGRWWLPLGALVFVALPPVWDFTTSGLENGLSFGWLGVAYASVAAVFAHPLWTWKRWAPLAVLVSLGPLVRPDLGLYWVALGAGMLMALGRRGKRSYAGALLALTAVPVAYQVFRMGYYASLVPNTALAKEAALSRFDQGWIYLKDLVAPYWLLVPFTVVVLVAVWLVPRGNRRHAAIWLTPAVAGAVHTFYVVRLGGGYMHGRMLLPAVLAVLLPVMAVRVSKVTAPAVAAVFVWALVCSTSLRVSYLVEDPSGLLVDERHFYQINAADPVDPNKLSTHPVTLHDYRRMQFMDAVRRYEAVRRDDPTYVEMVMLEVVEQRPLVDAHEGRDVVAMGNLGIFGYAVGDRAFLADAAGLADPIAARIQIPEDAHRGKPGHEKGLPLVWFRARFTSPTADGAEQAAARAMQCGGLKEVLDATSAPLTPARFLSNLVNAPSNTSLRIPADPLLAEQRLCEN
ncbi:MAG TPA: hypothetical protein VGR26_16660 [Acidimicrobiales bacterium]|nr:hypothetical protein [Acidimicrobiales bacterium]